MKFMQYRVTIGYRSVYSFWVGNHIESKSELCGSEVTGKSS